jgi:hypothetical protein
MECEACCRSGPHRSRAREPCRAVERAGLVVSSESQKKEGREELVWRAWRTWTLKQDKKPPPRKPSLHSHCPVNIIVTCEPR